MENAINNFIPELLNYMAMIFIWLCVATLFHQYYYHVVNCIELMMSIFFLFNTMLKKHSEIER